MRKMAVMMIALVVSSTPALATQSEGAVFLEFVGGALGGYAGAALGAITLSWAFSVGTTGWESLARAILGAYLGFAGGTILGSSLGVIAVGSAMGVQGNAGLAVLGAAAGTGITFGVGFAIRIPEIALPFAPLLAAGGATAGFNVGARPRE